MSRTQNSVWFAERKSEMFCRACGQQIREDAVFCPNCGQAVKKQNTVYTKPITETVYRSKARKFSVALIVLLLSFIMQSIPSFIWSSIPGLGMPRGVFTTFNEMYLEEYGMTFVAYNALQVLLYSILPKVLMAVFVIAVIGSKKKDVSAIKGKDAAVWVLYFFVLAITGQFESNIIARYGTETYVAVEASKTIIRYFYLDIIWSSVFTALFLFAKVGILKQKKRIFFIISAICLIAAFVIVLAAKPLVAWYASGEKITEMGKYISVLRVQTISTLMIRIVTLLFVFSCASNEKTGWKILFVTLPPVMGLIVGFVFGRIINDIGYYIAYAVVYCIVGGLILLIRKKKSRYVFKHRA